MKAATRANARTTEAARKYKPNPAKALSVAFFGGSVMGLAVASLGLLGCRRALYYIRRPGDRLYY